MEIKISNLDSINEAARQFIDNMGEARVFAFYGKMGAGKTTFIKAVCEQLGVDDVITSPTFAIVNEYTSATSGETVYHFDFYRIKKLDEVYDMGYEEYFYGGGLCFHRMARTYRGFAARRRREGYYQRDRRRLSHGQLLTACLSASYKPHSKRPSIGLQKTVNCNAKGGLSHRERPPFANRLRLSGRAAAGCCTASRHEAVRLWLRL